MLIVTIAALLMAASLAWFAYRLLQEEHRRSEARVAVLTAALDAAPAGPGWPASPAPGPVRGLARTAARTSTNGATPHAAGRAVTPDIVLLEDDSRNVRAFVSEHDTARRPEAMATDQSDHLRAPLPDPGDSESVSGAADVATRSVGLFADVPAPRRGDARGMLAVAAVALVGLLVAAYAMFGRAGTPEGAVLTSGPASGPASGVAARTTPATAITAARPAGVPLELVALTHAQERDVLVVRGRVRNPVSGSDRRVRAHVALLDGAGVVVGEASSPLAGDGLRAGREAPFETRLAVSPAMRRYRVTFRDPSGEQVVHVDRRAVAR